MNKKGVMWTDIKPEKRKTESKDHNKNNRDKDYKDDNNTNEPIATEMGNVETFSFLEETTSDPFRFCARSDFMSVANGNGGLPPAGPPAGNFNNTNFGGHPSPELPESLKPIVVARNRSAAGGMTNIESIKAARDLDIQRIQQQNQNQNQNQNWSQT